ncbi:hypothetical protein ACFE04_004258 [Oxalis oulophora]
MVNPNLSALPHPNQGTLSYQLVPPRMIIPHNLDFPRRMNPTPTVEDRTVEVAMMVVRDEVVERVSRPPHTRSQQFFNVGGCKTKSHVFVTPNSSWNNTEMNDEPIPN